MIGDPRPSKPRHVPAGIFAFDSSFVRPGVSSYLADVASYLRAREGRRMTVFGHTDAVGSDAYNKELGDRRARALLAILTTDAEAFDAICAEEDWGIAEHQAMLRTIGCDPGPPDGDVGEMTTAAVYAFVRGYNRGLWLEPRERGSDADLPETSELDAATMAAIRHAYVHYVGVDIPSGRLADVPFAGCGEFNRHGQDAADQRRVTLALFEGDQPSAPFPCTAGDAGACAIDDQGPLRCRFYREEVGDEETLEGRYVFWADQWMPTPSKWAYMSCLTSLPDGTPVTFDVYRAGAVAPSRAVDSIEADLPGDLEHITTVQGAVACGVAFAVWRPEASFHPFDPTTWYDYEGLDFVDEQTVVGPIDPAEVMASYRAHLDHVYYRPPLFRVSGDGHWLLSRAPGRRVVGLGAIGVDAADALVMTPDGRFARTSAGKRLDRDATVVTMDLAQSVYRLLEGKETPK